MRLFRSTLPLWMALVLAPSLSWGQSALRDPTMPPPGVGVAAGKGDGQPQVASTPAIQIRKLGPTRQTPEVGGRKLQTGEQVGAWRVVRITADGMVMQSGERSQTIPANPPIKKKMLSGSAAAPQKKTGNP